MSSADVVNELLRKAESPDLPAADPQQNEAHDTEATPFACASNWVQTLAGGNFSSVLGYGYRILAAEAQRRMEAGDPAGAARFRWTVVRLLLNEGGKPVPLLMYRRRSDLAAALNPAVLCLAAWVDQGGAPPNTLAELLPALAETHRYVYPRDWTALEWQRLGYPRLRQRLVTEASGSTWSTPAFGWDAGPYPWVGYGYSFTVLGVELPRVDRVGATALRAMRNRREAPEILREFDRIETEIVLRGRMTWPELAHAEPPSDLPDVLRRNKSNPLLREWYQWSPPKAYDLDRASVLTAEARLNLLRAAIEWRLAPADAKPGPATMKIEDRESPWRDPFAEVPFHATALPDGGGLLLYSLGPDLKDQQGQIEYDPTNGIMSAGDLTLEVKR